MVGIKLLFGVTETEKKAEDTSFFLHTQIQAAIDRKQLDMNRGHDMRPPRRGPHSHANIQQRSGRDMQHPGVGCGAFEDGMERHEGSGPVRGSCHEDQERVERGR